MKAFPFLTPILLALLITAHAQQEPALLSDPPDGSETPVPKVRAVFKPCVVEETTVTRQGGRDIIVQRLALDPNDPIKPVVPESPAAIPFDPAAAADFPDAPPAYLLFLSATENPWRFWTHDDDDSGETGGTDIPQTPGTEDTNGYDHRVNKMRDLIDFFPVDLDLKAALAIFLEGKYRYRLSHSAPQLAPCFKIVQVLDLHVANSDAYMRDLLVATSTKTLVKAPPSMPTDET